MDLIKKTEEDLEREGQVEEAEDEKETVSEEEIDERFTQKEQVPVQEKGNALIEKIQGLFARKKKEVETPEEAPNTSEVDAFSLLEENNAKEQQKKAEEDLIKGYINIAMGKGGIEEALKRMKKDKKIANPFIMDDFHDKLLEAMKAVKDEQKSKGV